MTFAKWLDTFLFEKNTNLDKVFEVYGLSGWNFIPASVVVEHIKIAPAHEQAKIKNILVKIDFMNHEEIDFFEHLAQALAR